MFVEYVAVLQDGMNSGEGWSAENPIIWIVGGVVAMAILWTIKR